MSNCGSPPRNFDWFKAFQTRLAWRHRLPIPAPRIPVSASDLLVNARDEPGLVHNLEREIPSADSINFICAFVRWYGLRLLETPLREHLRLGRPFRVITTVYTGSTERKALDWLVDLGAKVKVSYNTESTRLHAKAWRFHRESGYSTIYIGSSNLTKSALLDGVEWNVRLSEVTAADILRKFKAAFDSYWSNVDYEPYQTQSQIRDRLDAALGRARGGGATVGDSTPVFFDIHPHQFQEEMLERLSVERARHDRHRNLVVAARGGKTVVAALDFKALRVQMGNPTLLFVAHRREILSQAVGTFRHVLRDNTFGELYVDGHRPESGRHVFASIQSLAQRPEEVDPTFFDVVIVDEFHHAAADTYARLLQHIRPKELVGLTATPERADGESVLTYFNDYISVELRLWDALERDLLCPFQYFGLNDETSFHSRPMVQEGLRHCCPRALLHRERRTREPRAATTPQQVNGSVQDARSRVLREYCARRVHGRPVLKGRPTVRSNFDHDGQRDQEGLTASPSSGRDPSPPCRGHLQRGLSIFPQWIPFCSCGQPRVQWSSSSNLDADFDGLKTRRASPFWISLANRIVAFGSTFVIELLLERPGLK